MLRYNRGTEFHKQLPLNDRPLTQYISGTQDIRYETVQGN